MKKAILAIFTLTMAGSVAAQQIMVEREAEVKITKTALDQIYNFQFDSAETTIAQLEKMTGDHPGISLLKALHIYWKHLPLKKGTEEYRAYERLLNQTARGAEAALDRDDRNLEGVFFTLAAYGYLAAFYADEGAILKAIANARKAYASLKKGFKLKEEFAEFYFTTGLYNYYREKYPENHPAYRSFTWMFASGDKQLGIDQLKKASRDALFTGAEALYYLFHIHLRYEKTPLPALAYARRLTQTYPGNLSFKAYHAEALAAAGRYDEAAEIAQTLMAASNPFYNLPGFLIKGVTLEKNGGHLRDAETWYRKTIEAGRDAGFDANHYLSMAWAGLARIEAKRGNKSAAKEYYSKALQLTSYDIVVDEAKAYLK